MDYRNLGRTGIKVSELCLGTMQFGWTADEATSHAVLDASEEAGVNFIDTADIYSRWAPGNPGGVAEEILGRWLSASAGRRERIVLATKVRGAMSDRPNDQGLSRRHIVAAIHASLRRLRTDYVDLYQTHAPDDATSIEETLRALDDLVRDGLVRVIGCSNYPAWKLMQALWTSDRLGLVRFDSLQPHYNLLHRAEFERELRTVCLEYRLGVIPYSPLAGGFLTGKYRSGAQPPAGTRGETSERIQRHIQSKRSAEVISQLQTIGEARGKTASQVALGWLLSQPSVTSPIIGPRSIEQLRDNLGAVGLRLEAQEIDSLNAATVWDRDDS